MNARTTGLLKLIGGEPNAEGVELFCKLIGKYNVKNSFELDAYAYGETFPAKVNVQKAHPKKSFKGVGLKSEMNSIALINAKKITITKLHNKLINDIREYLVWRQIVPQEDRFDCLVKEWRKGRDLLIEAKTASDGPIGRTQIRQAIGQLYDYRFSFFPGQDIDLAILLIKKPADNIRALLSELKIELLWFEGKKLRGTIKL